MDTERTAPTLIRLPVICRGRQLPSTPNGQHVWAAAATCGQLTTDNHIIFNQVRERLGMTRGVGSSPDLSKIRKYSSGNWDIPENPDVCAPPPPPVL